MWLRRHVAPISFAGQHDGSKQHYGVTILVFSKNLFPLTALFFALVILLPFDARGQETRATLLGTVADQTGAVIKGATVTATAEATGLRQSAITDGNGQYRIPLLPVGAYALAVEAMSFDPAEQRGLTLQVGEKRRVDVILNVGQLGANITIEAPITDSAANTLATIVPQERVANLPLNGRQLQELALTAPGVAAAGGFRSNAFNQFGLATSNDGNAGVFSVNGAPSRANGFFLDGVDINVPEQGVIAYVAIRSAIHRHRRLFRSRHGDCQPPTESGERSACERSRRIRLQPGSLRRAPPRPVRFARTQHFARR